MCYRIAVVMIDDVIKSVNGLVYVLHNNIRRKVLTIPVQKHGIQFHYPSGTFLPYSNLKMTLNIWGAEFIQKTRFPGRSAPVLIFFIRIIVE